jgi:alpha-L-arabinofuranosidase
MLRTVLAGLALTLALVANGSAQSASAPTQIDVTILANQPGATINPEIYGQFAEHLGRGIYEGIYVGEKSPIPNTRGMRNDVIAALKELRVPLVRWPGGCFADNYHWRDGIGPQDKRTVRINTNWGGVPETNAFGTHEFMDFAEMIGAKVYINGNLGSGTPQEMAEWMEYMTSDTDATLVNLRRANGRATAWKVDYWAIGNESWGCGGNMRPEQYADLYRQYATFLRAPQGKRPQLIASGGHDDWTNWTEVLSKAPNTRNTFGIAHHYYTTGTGVWAKKGASLGFPESEWIGAFASTMKIEDYIKSNVEVMKRNDPEGRLGLLIDEWGTWYDPEPGREPRFLYQQNSIRDALVAAINFNIFQAHADRVKMANIAQMVNVLQAMILTDGPRMIRTPTYYAFQMYVPFQGATALPTQIKTPQYTLGATSVPNVSVTAARDASGRLQVGLVNLDPHREAVVRAHLVGATAQTATGKTLHGRALDAHNTFDAPNTVTPTAITGQRQGQDIVLRLPPGSVSVVALQ